MSNKNCSEESFRRDIAGHTMTVIRDDGVNRHIRFSDNGSSVYRFDLITWPGHLCYTGDMGTYVFQRLEDMFEFFRHDRENERLHINVGYWTEKLVAVDGNRGGGKIKAYNEEKFKAVINEYRVNWMREGRDTSYLNKEQRRSLWDAIEDEVIGVMSDGEHYAYQAANEFSWKHPETDDHYEFRDFWEHDCTEYTHSIIWCLYALAWGIKVYDEAKKAEADAAPVNLGLCGEIPLPSEAA